MPTLRFASTHADAVALAVFLAAVACIAPVAASGLAGSARSAVCADRIRGHAQRLASYADQNGSLPPAYTSSGNRFLHWSATLRDAGFAATNDTFQCPDALRGGAPRTNPGPNAADWEPLQIDNAGSSTPNPLTDDQPPRLAYAPSEMLMPRPKFTGGPGQRVAQIVSWVDQVLPPGVTAGRPAAADPTESVSVPFPALAVLLTEFASSPTAGWGSLSSNPTPLVIRSHLPIRPAAGVSTYPDIFSEPSGSNSSAGATTPRFRHPAANELTPWSGVGFGAIDLPLQAMGRHHPGETAHVALLDGSVRLITPQQSVTERLWGERFYSLSGNNTGIIR